MKNIVKNIYYNSAEYLGNSIYFWVYQGLGYFAKKLDSENVVTPNYKTIYKSYYSFLI